MTIFDPGVEEEVISDTEEEIEEPPMYQVLLHNDDYTTMEFVVYVLMRVFNRSTETAVQIMLNVHEQGIGVCGVYTYEVAETKIATVHTLAKENGFPLRCTMEEDRP